MKIDLLPAAQVHSRLLASMHKICFADPWSEGSFVESLTAAGTCGLIAAAQNSLVPSLAEPGPVGMIMWRAVADEAEILTIAVLPPWRRQGIGEIMLKTALETIDQSSIAHVYLEVAENNPTAQSMYLKNGFVQVGRRSGYYDSVDALVMKRGKPQSSLSSDAT